MCHRQQRILCSQQDMGAISTSYNMACPLSQHVPISAQGLNTPMQRFFGDKAGSTCSRNHSQWADAGEGLGQTALSPLEPCRALWDPSKQDQPSFTTHLCPQTWQAKGFSLVWVSMCLRRSFLFLEAKLQWGHLCGRRLAC